MPTGSTDHRKGMTLMVLAMLMLPSIIVFAKFLGETMSAGQIVWYRFFIQTLLITPFILAWRQWRPPPGTLLVQAARGVLLATATLFFFAAVQHLAMSTAISIFFVEPLILTLLSAAFLGEAIRLRRIAAIVVGFAGALVIIRPSFAAVGLPAVYPLATALCFAVYLLLTRRLSSSVNPYQMQWMLGISATVVMSAALAAGHASGFAALAPSLPAPGEAVVWVACVGLASTVSHLVIVFAVSHAPASLLAPFQYIEILGATAFGFLVFAEVPDGPTLAGVALIVGSGLYLFHRESVHARRPPGKAPPPNRRFRRLASVFLNK